MMLVKNGRSFTIPSSVSLLRISFRVLQRLLFFSKSQIWNIEASPSYAFVKSTVSSVSVIMPSITFSYFYGIFRPRNFFLMASRPKTDCDVWPKSLLLSSYLLILVLIVFFLWSDILEIDYIGRLVFWEVEGYYFLIYYLVKLSFKSREATNEGAWVWQWSSYSSNSNKL